MASILCVENDHQLRPKLVQSLKNAGYQVRQAQNGAEALGSLSKVRPDLVISATTMPVMCGYSFLDHVQRHRPDLATVPFIFLLESNTQKKILRSKQSGADDHISKPIDLTLLLASVKACLRRHQRRRHYYKKKVGLIRYGGYSIRQFSPLLDLIPGGGYFARSTGLYTLS